jgi:hypothetical protein
MTIRTLTFRTSLLIAGAALTASMAFAEPERNDTALGGQTQGQQYHAAPQNTPQ